MRLPLDIYDDYPVDMRRYLRYNGWHFNRKAAELASNELKRKSGGDGKVEKINAQDADAVKSKLEAYGVKIDAGNYDYVYVWNMCIADFYGSSIEDEQHMALFVKDTLEDPDAGDGVVMRRWYAGMVAAGMVVNWEDML